MLILLTILFLFVFFLTIVTNFITYFSKLISFSLQINQSWWTRIYCKIHTDNATNYTYDTCQTLERREILE